MDNPLAYKVGLKSPRLKPDVPNLPDWMSHYSSDSQYDHPLRRHSTKYGTYHISPVFDRSNTLAGYSLKFVHTGEGKQSALWHDLGVHTHPGKAIAKARNHHNSMSKNESVMRVASILKVARSD